MVNAFIFGGRKKLKLAKVLHAISQGHYNNKSAGAGAIFMSQHKAVVSVSPNREIRVLRKGDTRTTAGIGAIIDEWDPGIDGWKSGVIGGPNVNPSV